MRDIALNIRDFNKGRIPFLLEMKYARMREDAFRFLRGTSHLYFEDLRRKLPVKDPTRVWACGDLHLENFGSFKGNDRQVYFDMNDFDDSGLVPCTVEIIRTLVSIHLAAARIAFSTKAADEAAALFAETYFAVLRDGKARMVNADTARGIVRKLLRGLQKRKRETFLAERTVTKNGKYHLRNDHVKMWETEEAEKEKLLSFFRNNPVYLDTRKITITDAAHRIAGTGSLGIHRYVLLAHQQEKPHKRYLLELKEARPGAVCRARRFEQPPWKDDATRITTIQYLMQGVSPALLHPVVIGKTSFVLKELQPTNDRVELESCRGDAGKFCDLLRTLAEVTASAHLRATGRKGSCTADELVHFAQHQTSAKGLLSFAKQYARQVNADYGNYCKKYDSGYFVIR